MEHRRMESTSFADEKGHSLAADVLTVVVGRSLNRAGCLQDALNSVREQSARNAIARVVVSASSLSDCGAVADAFADLPIEFLSNGEANSRAQGWEDAVAAITT